MKFTARERTALRAMVELAGRYHTGSPTALSEVARAQELSLPYLEQVAGSLRRAGLLESVRGAHGGYILAREPAAVRVGDVFRAVEGSLVNVECVGRDAVPCSRQEYCPARNVWQAVMERLEDTLDATTLADLVPFAGKQNSIERAIDR